MKEILIIDDDVQIGNLEQEVLEREGYLCRRAYSGSEAAMVLKQYIPDLILLDLMLPGISGEELLKQMQGIPVIVVSAKAGIDDKVNLLLNGAADYITKPFHTQELLARIAVQLRSSSPNLRVMKLNDLSLDTANHTVECAGKNLSLTRTEYAILKLLMKNSTQVIAKSTILEHICEDTPDCTESSLKTHMSHLRSKLRNAGGREYIESVWGIGFKMLN